MIKEIQSFGNQSTYDLLLSAYGTRDLMIQFCNDNSVSNINTTFFDSKVFVLDTNKIENILLINYKYSTGTQKKTKFFDPSFFTPDNFWE